MKPSSSPAKTRHEAARNSGLSRETKRPSAAERYAGRRGYYFTSGTAVDRDSVRDVLKEPAPFSIAPDKARRQRCRGADAGRDFSAAGNYRSRQNADLLNRLYVPDEEAEEGREPGLLDIDPQYFKIMEGRPIKEKLNIRKYVEEARETLKTRLKLGYQLDEALLLEETFKAEQKRLRNCEAMHKLYADCFWRFLQEDYESSVKLLDDARKEAEKSSDMRYRLKGLEGQFGALKRQASVLEEKWRNYKTFQKFLYIVSPMGWRRKHDYIHRKGPSSVSLVSEMPSLFGRHRVSVTDSEVSLDSLLDLFAKDVEGGEEPLLYFSEARELVQALQDMESQNLSCFTHSEDLSGPILAAEQGLKRVETQFEAECASIAGKIEDLEAAMSWEERRIQSLRHEAREVLAGLFKEQILSGSTVSLHVCVEDVYEACIAPRDTSLGLRDLMSAIELKVETSLLTLDSLPFEIVKLAETETFQEELRIRKEARVAERKMNLMEKLKRRLGRALEAPEYRHGKPLKPRSEPPPIKKTRPKAEKLLTDKEKDFLDFFTDYCSHVDSARDYLAPQSD
jgi:hypothetical protein